MTTALKENENPVKKAAAMAKYLPIDSDDVLTSFLAKHPVDQISHLFEIKFNERYEVLSAKEKGLFANMKSALSTFKMNCSQIAEIKNRHEYPVLPFEPLTWKRVDGLPLLVPFRLNKPVFSGLFEASFSKIELKKSDTSFPQKVINFLFKEKGTSDKQYADGEYTFQTYFGGLIPVALIPVIKEAMPLFDDVFIIAEAGEYQIEKRPTPKPKPINDDPLVVGYYDNQLYLIAAFDLSPMEEAFVETAGEGGFTKLERSQDNIMLHQLAGYLEL